ncbi:MAG TPA: M23 family metallopeptidase [Clostridia bacterium]|jgi:murein DD-endopeptidase MepM/ murein hydrolase activator NlpD|nr:M23 family metallopeptidase [Clostridiaceae bacterium]HOF27194.1 M23 family metallopeptidase [Clostridia bacterium]HOM34744.1 M23 family metallopeptidase [Clostridia bacterium]HOR89311.1 M23 family metallopeptidase [Clostridia bacterium]HOT70281.1 M23 family metallopeptidase [Clostridia bacterium]
MRKGRTKLEGEGTLVYIPNGGKSSRVLKVTSPILKLSLIFYFMIAVIVCLSLSLVYFINENKRMNAEIDSIMAGYNSEMIALSTYVGKQAMVLDNKLNEIATLETAQQDLNIQIKELSSQLKLIAEKYTDSITLASASVTANNVAKFAEDTASVAAALEILLATNESTRTELVDFSEAANVLCNYLDSIPTLWPTKSKHISSQFGMRNHPILNQYKMHTGVDIGGAVGDEIYASATGTVVAVHYEKSGYGYWLRIKHSESISTLYAHCSKILVKAGDTVEKGQLIAYVGKTGLATGPHLHFEIRVNEVPINPTLFISAE